MSWVTAAGLFVLAATTTVVAVAGSPTAGPISVGTVVVSDVKADCAGAAGSQGLGSVESSAAASVASTVGGVTASPVAIAKESSLKADGVDSPSIALAASLTIPWQESSLTVDLVAHSPSGPKAGRL
jgi:hypothetical protein